MKKIIYMILAITGVILEMLCLLNNMELWSIPCYIGYAICLYKFDEIGRKIKK